ncbi:MATE family efflux transporter [Lachnospiraceae bacterium 46-15]
MNCFKEYAKYALFNVLGMLGLSCYILADTYFVAKGLGSDGLAALNLAIPIYSFIHGSGLMLGIGGATRYSIAKSQEQANRMNHIFSHTVFSMCALSMVFFTVGLLGAEDIARLLGADDAIFSMCRTYLQVLLLFSPLFMLNDVILCFVRNDGAPQLAMASMLAGSFSNIILDYVFIFSFRMGIFGAVLATGFAPAIGLAVQSTFFIQKKNHFRLVKCMPCLPVLGQIFSTGIPSLITELSSGIVIMAFNTIILGLMGNTGVAAYGIIANLSIVVIALYTGIAQGIQPLLSRYYGAGNDRNTRSVFQYALYTVILLSVIVYLGVFFCADWLASVFNSEGDLTLQAIAVDGMKLYFTACIFAGTNIIFSMYCTSTDNPRPASILSVLRGFLLILPMAFVMSRLWGMTGLWLAFPATELAAAVLGIFLLRHSRKPPI